MGVGLWLLAGVGAFGTSRLIRAARPPGWLLEAVLALTGAVAAGLAATALDFGGWREPDWRAGAFSVLAAFALIGIARLIRVLASRTA